MHIFLLPAGVLFRVSPSALQLSTKWYVTVGHDDVSPRKNHLRKWGLPQHSVSSPHPVCLLVYSESFAQRSVVGQICAAGEERVLLSPPFQPLLPPGLLDTLLTAVRCWSVPWEALGTVGITMVRCFRFFRGVAVAHLAQYSGSACPGPLSISLIEIGVSISLHQVTGDWNYITG